PGTKSESPSRYLRMIPTKMESSGEKLWPTKADSDFIACSLQGQIRFSSTLYARSLHRVNVVGPLLPLSLFLFNSCRVDEPRSEIRDCFDRLSRKNRPMRM